MSVTRPIPRVVGSPITSPLRGGALPWEDGGGGAPYTPRLDPLNLLWWDPTTLSAGAVSSWTDRIASVAATQGTGANQPTKSATAIGSAYPGVTSDGGDALAAAGAGAVLSGKTALTFVAAMVDATSSTTIAAELTSVVNTTNGAFAVVMNESAADRVGGAVRGTTGYSDRYAGSQSLAAAKVVAIGFDYTVAGANATAFIRINGTTQALTTITAANAAGSAANDTLYLFARAGSSLFWTGTFGNIVIRNSVSQDSGLDRLERYVGAQAGITW